jgi:ATP-binding cassette subfamily C protein EexD
MTQSSPKSTMAVVLRSGTGILTGTFFFSVAINLLALTAPLYMLQVYDRVLGSASVETLIYLSIFAGTALLVFSLLEGVRTRLLGRLGARYFDDMSERLLRGQVFMNSMPATTGAPPSSRDVDQVRAFVGGPPITAFLDFPWIFIFFGVLWLLHPWFFFAALIASLFLIVLAVVSEFSTRRKVAEAAGASQMARNVIDSATRNAEVIEALGMQPQMEKRWRELHNAGLGNQIVAQDRESKIGSISKFIRLATQSAMLGLGAYLVLMNEATPGVMIAASILSARALAPIDLAVGSWKTFVGARGSAKRLTGFLHNAVARRESQPLPAPAGSVSIDNASLYLPSSTEPVLSGVTLTVEPGQALALIGPSAAGKSSLLRMIAGVWQPSGGHVRLDGATTFNWPRDQFGKFVGYLPQDIELLAGTVAENIARMQEPDPEMVVEAAKRANAHDMILALPMGYETPVGERGVRLSGGQRQRIGLARAVFGNPVLLLLDEPNSNLDSAGEVALSECIRQFIAENKTVIVASHRSSILGTVTHAALLNQGRVVDSGPKDMVLARLAALNAPMAEPEPRVASAGGPQGSSVITRTPFKVTTRS